MRMMNSDRRDLCVVEWQFGAADLASVEAFLQKQSRPDDMHLHFFQPETFHDVYFDSADWRIYRAGYCLWLRRDATSSEATLKSLMSRVKKMDGNGDADNDGKITRHEMTEPLEVAGVAGDDMGVMGSKDVGGPAGPFGPQSLKTAIAQMPGPVGQHVRDVLGKQHLKPLFELTTHRHSVLMRQGSVPIAAIALDDVRSAVDQAHSPTLFRRVEIEAAATLSSGPQAALDVFVAKLRKRCGLYPATVSTFEAGLAAHNLDPYAAEISTLPKPPAVDKDMTFGDLALSVLSENFAQFASRESGARMGLDAEYVHRMRVAIRKLRAAMRLFKHALGSDSKQLRSALGWIADVLGAVRDLDVQLARLQFWQSQARSPSAIDAEAWRVMKDYLQPQRAEAQTRLLRAFNSTRYRKLLKDYQAFLQSGAVGEAAKRPARAELPALILTHYAQVRELGDVIDADSPAQALHALRIKGKHLRYTLEFAQLLYAKGLRHFVARVIELQDVLGEHQDAYVAIEQLQALVKEQGDALSAQTQESFDVMMQHYGASAQKLRKRFAKVYHRLKGKAWSHVQRMLDDE